jgi:hypothetical protein
MVENVVDKVFVFMLADFLQTVKQRRNDKP